MLTSNIKCVVLKDAKKSYVDCIQQKSTFLMKTCYSIDPTTLNLGTTLFAQRVILRFIFCLETVFN